MTILIKNIIILLFIIISCTGKASAMEIKSKFATLSYENPTHLRKFNNRLHMGRLRYMLRGRKALTIEDEVKNKLDVITEKVIKVLAMYPPHFQYSIKLFIDMDGVQKMFITLHSKDWRRPGFYYAPKNIIYLSIKNTRLKVMAHEVGHAVVENYFQVPPPVKIHELLAQFAEKHITD